MGKRGMWRSVIGVVEFVVLEVRVWDYGEGYGEA